MNVSINSAFGIALQTATSLYEGVLAKLVLLLVLVVLCFAGYRLLHWASALYGALAGVCLGVGLTGVLGSLGVTNSGLALSSAAMLVLGIVLGVVAYRETRLGIFLACGTIGALVGYVPGAFAGEMFKGGFVLVLLICFVLFGVTGVLFYAPAYVIATGLSGMLAGIVVSQLLGIASVPVQLLLGVILTIAGLAVQIVLPRRAAEKRRQAEEAMQDTDPHLPVQQEPEEPDTIDTISDTVAQHIDLSAPAAPPFVFPDHQEEPKEETEQEEQAEVSQQAQEPDEPEQVDSSTVVLPQPEPEPVQSAKQDDKKSIFDLILNKKEAEEEQPEHGESSDELAASPVLAEDRPVQPAEKFSLEELLDACDEDTNAIKQAEERKKAKKEKRELTPEQREQRKQKALTAVFAVVVVAASIVFAALGVQHVEVLLALCFCMYLAERYRLAAFGFAVLAVRRLYDAIVFFVQGGQLFEAMTDAVIGATFIILTLHMLRTYTDHKNQTEDTKESQDA